MTLEYWSVSGECSIWSAQEIRPGQLYARCLGQDHLRSDQNPGYLLGDEILPSHKGDSDIRLSRIPRKPTRAFFLGGKDRSAYNRLPSSDMLEQLGLFGILTLPETNSLHLKMDGWNTIISFWGPAYFQGRFVSFRERKCDTWCFVHATE